MDRKSFLQKHSYSFFDMHFHEIFFIFLKSDLFQEKLFFVMFSTDKAKLIQESNLVLRIFIICGYQRVQKWNNMFKK